MKKQYINTLPIATYGLSNVSSLNILAIDEVEMKVFYRINNEKVRFGKLSETYESFSSCLGTIKLNECIRLNF